MASTGKSSPCVVAARALRVALEHEILALLALALSSLWPLRERIADQEAPASASEA
jgi:hypothetical protein